jgi:hypothetical protein
MNSLRSDKTRVGRSGGLSVVQQHEALRKVRQSLAETRAEKDELEQEMIAHDRRLRDLQSWEQRV